MYDFQRGHESNASWGDKTMKVRLEKQGRKANKNMFAFAGV